MRRAVKAAIENALRRLCVGDPSDRRIHEARKNLKMARSRLRLGRAVFDKTIFLREDAVYSRASRILATVRDDDVFAVALERLLREVHDDLTDEELASGRALAAEARRKAAYALADGVVLREASGLLRASLDRLSSCTLKQADWSAFDVELRQAFKRAARIWRAARSEPSNRKFHKLRKKANILRYGLEWLGSRMRRSVKTEIRALYELSGLLGEDHDLVVLRERLGRSCIDEVHALRRSAKKRQKRLRQRALKLGRRIFLKKYLHRE